MGRRELIHHKTGKPMLTPKGALTQVGKTWHLHYCVNRECRQIYEDYDCADVGKNGRCHDCRGAVSRPNWIAARDPHPCCTGNTQQVTDPAEIVRYHLGGPGPWFQCQTCARCHGWPCNDERKT